MQGTSLKATARLHSPECRLVVKKNPTKQNFTFQSAARRGSLAFCLEVNLGKSQLLKTRVHCSKKVQGLSGIKVFMVAGMVDATLLSPNPATITSSLGKRQVKVRTALHNS